MTEHAALVLLWSLATGHPDAGLLKQYADSAGVPPLIMWAVATVESGHGAHNRARGAHGEIGRMQLARVHTGAFAARCGTRPLTDYHTNLCVGAHLLRRHYEESGNWPAAIRRYNGRGVTTLAYLAKVEQEIGRIVLNLGGDLHVQRLRNPHLRPHTR